MPNVTLNGNVYPDNIFAARGYLITNYFGGSSGFTLWQQMWTDGKADVAGSATSALQWASLTTGLVSATDYSSKAYAIGGTGITGSIGASKEWATITGATVNGAEYSAKEYAIGTTVAAGSSKSWATLTGAYVTGTSLSAQEWATGVYKRGSAGYGSAKDWATYIGGTVDGTSYSALYSANAAAASAAAAAASVVALSDTSSTSTTIGLGSKTFTVSTGKHFINGEYLQIAYSSGLSNYMHGYVTSYSSTSLTVMVTDVGGSGTYAAWTISPSGTQGSTGAAGSNKELVAGTVGGTSSAITLTTQAAISTAQQGHSVKWLNGASANPTGAVTLAVDTSGVISLYYNGSATIPSGTLPANAVCSAYHDGTRWNFSGAVGAAGASSTESRVDMAMNAVLAMGLTSSYQLRYNSLVDAFNDTTAINGAASTAVYDPTNHCYRSGNSAASFLDHFDNFSGAFVDSSSNAYLMTPTGVQTWTGFSKFGSGCAQFDGTSSQLTGPASNAAYKFNTGVDFTIECWSWQTATGTSPVIWDQRAATSSANGIALYVDSTGHPVVFTNNAAAITSSIVILQNTWNHIAVVRIGSTVTLWVNGASGGTATVSANLSDGNFSIGRQQASGANYWPGFIDCVRVVNGTGVYNSGFTPSTTALTAITNCTLLLQFDGSLTDTSTSGLTITNTNVALTPVPKIGTGCARFDGSTSKLAAPSGSLSVIGSGNFTIEAMVWLTSYTNYACIASQGSSDVVTGYEFKINQTTGYPDLYNATAGTTAVPLNQWVHVAAVRSGTTLTYYVNGVPSGTATVSNNFNSSQVYVGCNQSGIQNFPGWMDELRISNTARYTTTFTPSTTAFTSDANTLLLLHFDSLNNDVSTNLVPISYYGAPFANPVFGAACARFDGSASYLTGPAANAAFKFAADFTVECWVNPQSFANVINTIFDTGLSLATGIGVFCNQTTGVLYVVSNNSNTIVSASAPKLGCWNHVALVRQSGTLYIYLNGVSVGTAALAANLSNGSLSIGSYLAGTNLFKCYLDDFRINNTTAVYPNGTTFTPPTSALTAITGTSLLLHFDGGTTPFIDSSANNLTITNNGSPGVICVAPKFGTGAWFGDGSAGTLLPMNGPWDALTGNFTIDCWVYPVNTATPYGIFSNGVTASSAFDIFCYGNGNLAVWCNSSYLIQAGTVPINTWTHIAVVRNSGTITAYINGVSIGSASNSTAFISTGFAIGSRLYSGGTPSQFFNGFIDEVRVLNGTAAWTTGFTPPTSQYSTNIALQTINLTAANGTPTAGTAIVRYWDIAGGASLGTDVVAYMSRDGGTTWTAAATSTNVGPWDSGGNNKIVVFTFDVSAQPGGSTPVLKLVTNNNVTVQLSAQALIWS